MNIKRLLFSEGGKIIISTVLLLLAFVVDAFALSRILSIMLYASALILAGFSVFVSAIRGILRGDLLDEKFLMSIASIGAMIIGEFAEGAAVMIFFIVGEYFEHRAVNKSRNTIKALMDICPDTAVKLVSGEEITLDSDELEIGDIIRIRPGERVAADCEIISGNADIDTSAMTGESIPFSVVPGDRIVSGSVVIGGVLEARVLEVADKSAAARVLELVEDATERKSREENFITVFSRFYTPIVVGLALLLAFIPPLAGLTDFKESIYRALSFLVISCPCALVISVPMAFFAGIGVSASHGILFKGSSSFSPISRVRTVAFDKTGTLTSGALRICEVIPESGMSGEHLISIAAAAEYASSHPIAEAIKAASVERLDVRDGEVIAGMGSAATLSSGERVYVGNVRLMDRLGIETPSTDTGEVYVARENNYLGKIVLRDKIKDEAKSAVAALHTLGVTRSIILSGDKQAAVDAVRREIGIDEGRGELLPEDKFSHLEALIEESKNRLMFVGDGINDAPSLKLADVGVAMGGIGTDSAKESADVVITSDNLSRIPKAIKTARKTLRIAKENIIFAIGIKVLVLVFSAIGITNMWLAVFADVGVLVLAVLNSMRLLAERKKKTERDIDARLS